MNGEIMTHQESSDGMQEIQSEETFTKDALMWVDSASFWENLITLLGFLAIIILTICTGIVSTPSINQQASPRNFNDKDLQKFSFDAAPISPYNRFISFDIAFIKKDTSKGVTIPVDFSYHVEVTDKDKTYNKTVKTYSNLLAKSDPGTNSSQAFALFNDQLIHYQSIELTINIDKKKLTDFKGISIIAKLGTHDHTTFQAYFRFVYSVFELSSISFLIKRMRKDNRIDLHLEQRMIIPLLVCAALSNNPLYIFHAYNPTHFFFFFEAFANSLFEGCLWLTVLNIFDFMYKKNVKLDLEFCLPKLIYCSLTAISHFIYKTYLAFGTFSDPAVFGDNVEVSLRNIEILFLIGFLCWASYLFVKSAAVIDLTERSKYIMYMAANLALMVLVAVILVFARFFEMFKETAAVWVCTFVGENVYVLMMIYYHWPYETQHDQTIVEEDQAQFTSTEQIAEIADPMNEGQIDDDSDDSEEEDDEEEEEEE